VKYIVTGIILLMAVGFTPRQQAPPPLYKRPPLPLAVVAPGEVFLRCGGDPRTIEADYYCIDSTHLEGLRVYMRELHKLVERYEQ